MITIQNKEIRSSRGTCTKVVEKMCLNRKEMHNPRRNNMLAYGMTYEKRETLSNYQTILTLSEIILTGEMQRYASRAKSYLQDNGLYKQQAKKNINIIMAALSKLQLDFYVFERYTSIKSITQSFPLYAMDYVVEGESIGAKVQQAYTKATADRIQLMFIGYKQFFDRHRMEHSELIAAAYTVMELAIVGRDISNTIHRLINENIYGYDTKERPTLRMLDKVATAVREMLAFVIRDAEMTCDSEEFKPMRDMLVPIATGLVDGKPVKEMLMAVAEHTFRYMDYCTVRLWLAAHEGLSDKERKAVDDMGINTDAFIAQLRAMPLPEYEDVWDLQEALPKGEEIDGTPMFDFFMRCCDRVPYITDLQNKLQN